MTDVYRHGAAVLVLKPAANGAYELLLVHKPRKRDAWQLPQGGAEEGETLEQRTQRKMRKDTRENDQIGKRQGAAPDRRFRRAERKRCRPR